MRYSMIQLYKVKNKISPELLLGARQLTNTAWNTEIKGQREMGGPEPLQRAAPHPHTGPRGPGAELDSPPVEGTCSCAPPFAVRSGGACPGHCAPGRSQVRGGVW